MARYKLIGYEIQGQDTNEQVKSLDDQHGGDKSTVVYETDDLMEANAILGAGGFFRDRDNFITVSQIVDSDNPLPTLPPTPRKG
jgi:hypothetical protein